MKKVKVSEAEGKVLDALVAQVQGYTNLRRNVHRFDNSWILYPPRVEYGAVRLDDLDYSTNWGLAGPIIECEGINTFKYNKLDPSEPDKWCGHKVVVRADWRGDPLSVALGKDGHTPLIAAMRCYVASKLGEEVEVPEELLK